MNPAARSTKAARMVERVRRLQPAPEIHLTEYAGHASVLAEQLAGDGADVVVAVGGDGTVNEVLQGICKVNATRPDPATHAILGTLPAGTMNVFACELGFGGPSNIVTPWHFINEGAVTEIDLWKANETYFLQLAGVGVDAEIVKRTTWEMKKRYGPLSYVLSALQVLRQPLPRITLQVPGEADRLGCLALIGSGRHYGGPFKVFPQASNSDGKLDVLLFEEGKISLRHMVHLVRGVLTGSYDGANGLSSLQAEQFTITCEPGTAVELDGELCGGTPVTFQKAGFRLRVAAPFGQASARQVFQARDGSDFAAF